MRQKFASFEVEIGGTLTGPRDKGNETKKEIKLTEQELLQNRAVSEAIRFEVDRRTKLSDVQTRLSNARRELAKEEAQITNTGITDDSSFDRSIDAIAKLKIRVDQLERLEKSIDSQEQSTLTEIGNAKAGAYRQQAEKLRMEVVAIRKKTAPLLSKLQEIEGVEFAPQMGRGLYGQIHQNPHLFAKSLQLEQAADGLEQSANNISGNAYQQGSDFFKGWMESTNEKATGDVGPFSSLKKVVGF